MTIYTPRESKFWKLSVPIYTTRPHGSTNETASYSQSLWMTMLAQIIIWFNIVLWGGIGIVKAFEVIL